jgi:hypothetical protein
METRSTIGADLPPVIQTPKLLTMSLLTIHLIRIPSTPSLPHQKALATSEHILITIMIPMNMNTMPSHLFSPILQVKKGKNHMNERGIGIHLVPNGRIIHIRLITMSLLVTDTLCVRSKAKS